MNVSNLAYSSLVLAMLSVPAFAASDNNSMMKNGENTNMTEKDCTKLPSQKNNYSDEEFKKRTEWCNKMKGDVHGSAPAGKDSSAITAKGSSNTNAPVNSGK